MAKTARPVRRHRSAAERARRKERNDRFYARKAAASLRLAHTDAAYIERIYDFAVIYGGIAPTWPSASYWIVPEFLPLHRADALSVGQQCPLLLPERATEQAEVNATMRDAGFDWPAITRPLTAERWR